MKKLSIILCLFCWQLWSQNEQLAQNYFDKGEFEKAKISYESLLGAQPYNSLYFQRVVECQQQLQDFPAAEKILINRNKQFQQAALLVELGYNYQLQKQPEKAKKQYELALDKIRKNIIEKISQKYKYNNNAIHRNFISTQHIAPTSV